MTFAFNTLFLDARTRSLALWHAVKVDSYSAFVYEVATVQLVLEYFEKQPDTLIPLFYCPQVAVHVAEKLLQLGAIPLTFSDSSGFIYEPEVRSDAKRRLDGFGQMLRTVFRAG